MNIKESWMWWVLAVFVIWLGWTFWVNSSLQCWLGSIKGGLSKVDTTGPAASGSNGVSQVPASAGVSCIPGVGPVICNIGEAAD